MDARTHYDIFGGNQKSSTAQLRKAYLELARRYHPDLNQNDPEAAQAAMQRVNEAWHVLSDNERRRDYDATLLYQASGSATGNNTDQTSAEWQPFDDGPEIQPAEADPTPLHSKSVPRWVTLAPAIMLGGAVLVFAFGVLVNNRGVVALGGVLGVSAVAGFVLMPLLVMSRAERDPNL